MEVLINYTYNRYMKSNICIRLIFLSILIKIKIVIKENKILKEI